MNKVKESREWPWPVAGIALGLVITFAFVTGHPVGTATTYERVIGFVLSLVSPDYVVNTVHYAKEAPPVLEWQVFFVFGMILAGVIGRYLVARRKSENVPEFFVKHLGNKPGKRYLHAFVGGLFLLFGSRLAGGCTSGLFMSGGSQLAVAFLVFSAAMFVSGIVTAKLLFKGRNV